MILINILIRCWCFVFGCDRILGWEFCENCGARDAMLYEDSLWTRMRRWGHNKHGE